MDAKTLKEGETRLIAFLERKRQIAKATARLQQIARTMVTPTTKSLSNGVKAKARKPPRRPRHITDRDLPLKTLHDLMWPSGRYVLALAQPSSIQLDISFTETPGPSPVPMVPWIIEAPLDSVEILEAILKPSHPFQIHTARHVHRGCNRTASCLMTEKQDLREYRKLHSEYTRLQGRLELDRDISFICIPSSAVLTVRDKLWGVFTPVLLHYVSIPWNVPSAEWPTLVPPWALVLHDKSHPGMIHTYEKRLGRLLEQLGLSSSRFQRSLVKHGTTPLPQCLWDWFAGRPGTTAALPYFAAPEEVDANRQDADAAAAIKAVHTGPPGEITSCCLPTYEKRD